jgi:hypothetical protein
VLLQHDGDGAGDIAVNVAIALRDRAWVVHFWNAPSSVRMIVLVHYGPTPWIPFDVVQI